jgi:hypothetical protein
MVPLAYTSQRERLERKRSVARHQSCEALFLPLEVRYGGLCFFEICLVLPAASRPWPRYQCRSSEAEAVAAQTQVFVGTVPGGSRKRSATQIEVKYRVARICRARLRNLSDDLEGTRKAVPDLHENFWLISEQDIREMLAKTERKIGRFMGALDKAA